LGPAGRSWFSREEDRKGREDTQGENTFSNFKGYVIGSRLSANQIKDRERNRHRERVRPVGSRRGQGVLPGGKNLHDRKKDGGGEHQEKE